METKNIVVLLATVVYPLLAVKCVGVLLIYAVRWFLIFGYCYISYQCWIGYPGRVTDSKQWSQLTPVGVWHEFRTPHSALCTFDCTLYITARSLSALEIFRTEHVSTIYLRSGVFTRKNCPANLGFCDQFPREHLHAKDSEVLRIEAGMQGRELHDSF